jgi:RNA polymerase sigma-70 factor (ECF subfamily)
MDMTAVELNDSSFVARLRSGDDDAFEILVRHHAGPLLRVARRFMRCEEDARDALQDAFVAIYKSIGRFEAEARLSTWVHRVMVNACLMRLRWQRRRPEEELGQDLPLWRESMETMMQRSQLRELVRSSIDRLPATYRQTLLLRDIEELSTDETAQLLGVTRNAVKIRLHRGRQALRTLLDPHMM